MNGNEVKEVSEIKFLAVNIDNKFSWKSHNITIKLLTTRNKK